VLAKTAASGRTAILKVVAVAPRLQTTKVEITICLPEPTVSKSVLVVAEVAF
jgi:hypothetical protein